MNSQLFITTSNGIYVLDDHSGKSQCILSNKHTSGFFKKKASGYFGITFHEQTGKIIVASREKLGTKKHDKPSTDTKLHSINPLNFEHEHIATIMDVHDVHQITSDGQFIYISDTGKNRVIVYDIENKRTHCIINIGSEREDINHINALRIRNKTLLIGLNNRGRESAILSLDITEINQHKKAELDALELGTVKNIKNVSNSHDLEPYNNTILCCSSHDGRVIDTNDAKTIISEENWVRGMTINQNTLWVGASMFATRRKRHSKALDGSIHKYNLDNYNLLESYKLNESGQINDMINLSTG